MMLQFIKPLAAVFTFVVGTFAAYVLMPLPTIRPVGCTDSAGPVEAPVCELAARPELYDGKLVRVRMNIRRIHSSNASFITSAYCGDKPIAVTCASGYESCSELLDDIARTRPSDVELSADGLFSASVISYGRSGTAHRLPLFEITETRSVRVTGGKFPLKAGYGDDIKYVDKITETPVGRGRGTGHGYGSGTGHGHGGGPRTMPVANVAGSGIGTGPERGGGYSGGANNRDH